jgi:hypothetical protein
MLSVVEKQGVAGAWGQSPVEFEKSVALGDEPQNVAEARQWVAGGGGRRVSSRTKVGRMIQTAIQRASSVVSGVLVAGLLAGSMLATPANAQIVTPSQPNVVATQQVQDVQQARAAVAELRQLHEQKKLDRLFERDPNTGAYVNARLHDVLKRLPVIGPETTPEQLLAYGLIDAIPRGLAQLEQMPRYFDGKQVFVRTTTSNDKDDFGKFQAGGTSRITHRGTIVGRDGDKFYVEVPGARGGKQTIEVSKAEMLELNQPSSPSGLTTSVNGIGIDYKDPIARGKIAQGFFLIAEDLAKLDFTKPANDRTNREVRLDIVKKLFWNQHSEYVANHHKDWQRNNDDMSNILNGGVGVCTVQGTTQWAYAQPFERIAGIALLNVAGSTIDLDRAHNFNILWLLGSEEMYVTDRTWMSGNEHPTIEEAFGAQGYNRNRYMVAPNDRAPGDLAIDPSRIKVKQR